MNVAEAIRQTESDQQVIDDAAGPAKQPCFGQWQPIETAPKDGSSWLLFERDQYTGSGLFYGSDWITEDGGICRPTHWMPLPEGPK